MTTNIMKLSLINQIIKHFEDRKAKYQLWKTKRLSQHKLQEKRKLEKNLLYYTYEKEVAELNLKNTQADLDKINNE